MQPSVRAGAVSCFRQVAVVTKQLKPVARKALFLQIPVHIALHDLPMFSAIVPDVINCKKIGSRFSAAYTDTAIGGKYLSAQLCITQFLKRAATRSICIKTTLAGGFRVAWLINDLSARSAAVLGKQLMIPLLCILRLNAPCAGSVKAWLATLLASRRISLQASNTSPCLSRLIAARFRILSRIPGLTSFLQLVRDAGPAVRFAWFPVKGVAPNANTLLFATFVPLAIAPTRTSGLSVPFRTFGASRLPAGWFHAADDAHVGCAQALISHAPALRFSGSLLPTDRALPSLISIRESRLSCTCDADALSLQPIGSHPVVIDLGLSLHRGQYPLRGGADGI